MYSPTDPTKEGDAVAGVLVGYLDAPTSDIDATALNALGSAAGPTAAFPQKGQVSVKQLASPGPTPTQPSHANVQAKARPFAMLSSQAWTGYVKDALVRELQRQEQDEHAHGNANREAELKSARQHIQQNWK